jgi:DNA-binding HxlR family transcriptional regulator
MRSVSTADPSPLVHAAERVGDRWVLLLIDALLDGPRRFGELQDQVTGIAPNILSSRLKQLERHRVVIAQPYQQRPPRYAYELTASGYALAAALRVLAQWGATEGDGEPVRHHTCGDGPERRRRRHRRVTHRVEEPSGSTTDSLLIASDERR